MLNKAEAFEHFLHTKYIGHKRFSLEGAETLIPVLDQLLENALQDGLYEVMIGMSHRGRLNVLANLMGKKYSRIFREFDGEMDPDSVYGSGDVKYHLGAKGLRTSSDGRELKLTLASNPSHLEAADPVVEGMVRARQDELGDINHQQVIPVLIHGDAAFAGQGVVAETLNLSALSGYRTGGTIHIVVNNGIGFTTAPADARSSVYATDVAKMVQAPIFHVNGDDPEASVHVIKLAYAFRKTFNKDVVVDLVCYRRHGHNEGDDPSFTQPQMYAAIKRQRAVRKLYTEWLVNRGDLSIDEAEHSLSEFSKMLETIFEETQNSASPQVKIDDQLHLAKPLDLPESGVPEKDLQKIISALTHFPDTFTAHPKLKKQIVKRAKSFENDQIDWGLAEALAIGSILLDQKTVRLSGQDSRRGTFSQRHSVLVNFENGNTFTSLNHISEKQGQFLVYDSLLSEYAVMGFEFGYSVVRPDALVLWEAQFGDFSNGGQIIIDQFISSAEDKWGQSSRLSLLLPHGFEGQGPEHSSARIERFLALCAEGNMRVVYPSTANQYFHLLRSQAKLTHPKPMIVFTPKSLLRAEPAKCRRADLTSGRFEVLLDDTAEFSKARRLLLCTGKIAHELFAYRRKQKISDTAIVRLEQLYPFPFDQLADIFEKYKNVQEINWVQEEPRNMGPWNFAFARIKDIMQSRHKLAFVGRLPSGSPATGSYQIHQAEQQALISRAFGR